MSVGAGNVIDQLWIALGIKPDTSGLKEVRERVNEAKESLLSVGGAVKAFVAGFAIKEIADIGSTFEQNRIQIAGFLSALGQSTDFNAGLNDAADVIQQITKDAALLPGEAQEYIEVFKAGLPFVKGAMPGGSLAEMTKFTNQLTAIGKTFGLDAGLIAREFDHMLSPGRGTASLRLPLFRQLLPFMHQIRGQANLTAESFNAMGAPQRLQLLEGTFAKLQPMLDASANSFDAMFGAVISDLKQITRIVSRPIFEGMKKGLDQINNLLFDKAGKLTPFGQKIVDDVQTVMAYLTQFLTMGAHLVKWFATSKVGAVAFKTALTLLGTALAGLVIQKTVGSFMSLFRVMTNLKSLLMGGLFTAIALIAEDLYQFATGGDSVTGLLVQRFPKLIDFAQQLADVMGDLVDLFTAKDSDGKTTPEKFKDALLEAKPAIIAAAAAIGIALAAAFAPITTTLTALAALGVMADQIATKKGFFYDRVSAAGKGIGRALGAKVPEDVPDMGGAGVSAPTPLDALNARAPLYWNPAQSSGFSPLLSPPSVNNVTNHQQIDIHIKSTDPKEAGREVHRAITRNSQDNVKL